MPSLDLSELTTEQRPSGAWAAALLHAIARDEAAGRRPVRLTEPKLDTWMRFRGRLTGADFVTLLLEDAAVLHRMPFDPSTLDLPNQKASIDPGQLPANAADGWLRTLGSALWPAPGQVDEWLPAGGTAAVGTSDPGEGAPR